MSPPLVKDKADIVEGLLNILLFPTCLLPHVGGEGVEVYRVQSPSLHTSSHRLRRTRAFGFFFRVQR